MASGELPRVRVGLAITGPPVESLANKQVRGFYQRGLGPGMGVKWGGSVVAHA